jgi:Uma2 family endonuclease
MIAWHCERAGRDLTGRRAVHSARPATLLFRETAVKDMVRIEPTLSYEHLRQLPEDGNRYEILEGRLAATPAPSTRHQRIVTRLCGMLLRAEQAGYGTVFVAPTDVVLHPVEAAVEPDVLFVSAQRTEIITEMKIEGAPDLIIEVLSDSTRERDLGVKLRQYARHGVRWYWVVDPDKQHVRIFTWRDGAYEEHASLGPADRLESPLFPTITSPVRELFV